MPDHPPVRRALSASAIGLLLALVALFVWQLANRDNNAFRDALRAGKTPEAPAFTLPRLDHAGTISRQSLAGHAAVLNFWASWCPPCADEAPDLNALSIRYEAQGQFPQGCEIGFAKKILRRRSSAVGQIHLAFMQPLNEFRRG